MPAHRKPALRVTVIHALGVTGQHEVLMFGQCTRDPEKVASIQILHWYTGEARICVSNFS